MAFWMSFIYAGARAIGNKLKISYLLVILGQREHYALCTEQVNLFFLKIKFFIL